MPVQEVARMRKLYKGVPTFGVAVSRMIIGITSGYGRLTVRITVHGVCLGRLWGYGART